MKKYIEILKDIEKARKALKNVEEKEKTMADAIFNAPDLETKISMKRGAAADLAKTSEKRKDLEITIKLLRNNARVALFYDVAPVIIETLEKYSGKPYGEKTRQKISDIIKDKTGCRCYITQTYSYSTPEINVFPPEHNNNITIGTNSEHKILIENKIQPLTMDQLKLYYVNNTYFEDIPAAIKEMRKAYKKAYEKQKELETLCNEFNIYAVEGIERIYKDRHLYERL